MNNILFIPFDNNPLQSYGQFAVQAYSQNITSCSYSRFFVVMSGGGWESKKAIGEGDGRERMGIKMKSPTLYKKERIGSRLSLSLFQSVMVTDSLKIFVSCRGRMLCLRLNFLPLVDILLSGGMFAHSTYAM